MQVTLKEARRYEEMIKNASSFPAVPRSLKRRVVGTNYTAAQAQLLSLVEDDLSKLEAYLFELVEARQTLRNIIADANSASGINEIVREIALLGEKLSALNRISRLSLDLTVEQEPGVAFQVDLDQIVTSKLHKKMRSLLMQIASLKDKTAAINAQTKIELPESVVRVVNALL